ncbi:hypothetical protein SCLCIDRAFT_1210861 [Scleroderma citrinum Foug A]|uniref:Uncharacterized protein n=1 Tax=Scleroderma citrinum Foug A TaxID=1036808 RepID=A0A0C3APB6_9AGAM|nr:hypothetical protein SCLCIDRAFT_1210861 [Scleroderma citrinum Foug A]
MPKAPAVWPNFKRYIIQLLNFSTLHSGTYFDVRPMVFAFSSRQSFLERKLSGIRAQGLN